MPKGQGKGDHKGKQKGEGKGKGKAKPAFEPPPWSSTGGAPATSATTTSTQSTPPSAQTKAEAKLQEIATVLKKKDDPELQTLAQEVSQLHSKNTTSTLHKAVKKHGDAKGHLHAARQARANLHTSWRQYLDAAVETWKTYIEEFEKEDKRLEEQVDQATQGLTSAQEFLDDAKHAATAEELEEQSMDLDDAVEVLDRTARSGPDLREGLIGMKDSLEKLQAKTEEMVEANEAGNKRPRLEENTGKSRAMEPFGGAGR